MKLEPTTRKIPKIKKCNQSTPKKQLFSKHFEKIRKNQLKARIYMIALIMLIMMSYQNAMIWSSTNLTKESSSGDDTKPWSATARPSKTAFQLNSPSLDEGLFPSRNEEPTSSRASNEATATTSKEIKSKLNAINERLESLSKVRKRILLEKNLKIKVIAITGTPIKINGNADFAAQATANGWPGNGTAANPYVIENLVIVTNLTDTHAIDIRNTNVYFIIRNCTVSAIGNSTTSLPSSYPSGIYLENVSFGMVERCQLQDSTGSGLYTKSSNNITIIDSQALNNSVIGFYVTLSTNVTLFNNTAMDNGIYGFDVDTSATNIILDGNIAVSNRNDGYFVGYTGNVTLLRNIAISNNETGFLFYYLSNVLIKDNIASNNTFNGFSMYGSLNHSVLEDNIAEDNGEQGFELISGNNAGLTLVNNTAINNTKNGFELNSVNGTALEYNYAMNNTWDGFSLLYFNFIIMTHNYAADNAMRGYYLGSSGMNDTFTHNIAEHNTEEGFWLYDIQMAFENNSALNNMKSGYYISNSNDLILRGNDAISNLGRGFYLLDSNNITVDSNIANDNAMDGFYLYYCDNVTMIDNFISENRLHGINLQSSDNGTFLKNVVMNNEQHGIWFYFSDNNTLINNTFYMNGLNGISLNAYSDDNTIVHNDFLFNNEDDVQATSDDPSNIFDHDYYSDHVSPDADGDGIVDVPYSINGTGNVQDQNPTTYVHRRIETFPPQVDDLSDVTLELGTIDYQLAWNASDIYPGLYVIFKNGTQVSAGRWDAAVPIVLNINATTLGIVNYTLVVWDAFGNDAKDTAFVTVEDTIAPVFDGFPNDVTYEIGSTGYQLAWSVTDLSSGNYVIYLNGTQVASGQWTSGTPITITVDGLDLGVHNYTIMVSDVSGNSAVDTAFVIVVPDTSSPTLTSIPADVTYTVGTTGNQLSWTATDSNPGTYVVYQNGTRITNGTWTSGDPIVINIDGLSVGSYNYTIVVQDQYGNTITDTVIVTVVEVSPTTTTSDTGTAGTNTSTLTNTSPAIPTSVSTPFNLMGVLLALGIGAVLTRRLSSTVRHRYK